MNKVTYVDVIDDQWKWGETYLYSYAKYLVACPEDRTCQVGMGVMAFGKPLGEKIRFSGQKEIIVIGAGQLHFRVDDGRGRCKVGFTQLSQEVVKVNWDF